ncbi:MAG: AAA family ATPase [Anaerolineae bacterium]|nr:AAA family ATPase [Anaerolineae bacterium]
MSAKIITVFNQKGGAGKTTVSVHLAGTLGLRGARALIVDMDEQNTATRWVGQADEEHPFPAAIMNLAALDGGMHREVKKQIDRYDFIVIDCPPAVHSQAPMSALLISDLGIIPVVPSPADLWACVLAKELANKTRGLNDTLHVRVLANSVQRRTSLARDAIEILSEDEEIPLMKSMIGARSSFRECQAIGATVHRVPGAKEAIAEVEAMVDEALAIIG